MTTQVIRVDDTSKNITPNDKDDRFPTECSLRLEIQDYNMAALKAINKIVNNSK